VPKENAVSRTARTLWGVLLVEAAGIEGAGFKHKIKLLYLFLPYFDHAATNSLSPCLPQLDQHQVSSGHIFGGSCPNLYVPFDELPT